MDDVTSEVKGLAELQQALEDLSSKVANKGVRDALKAGAAPIQRGMVQQAPKLSGFLAQHFNVKFKRLRGGIGGSAFIGPQGKIDYPAFASGAYRIIRNAKGKISKVGKIAVATVARFLEFGTSKMPKNPFMTRAWEANKYTALDNMTESLRDTVEKAAAEAPKGPTA
jgi:HK97 gp10 family phage protein